MDKTTRHNDILNLALCSHKDLVYYSKAGEKLGDVDHHIIAEQKRGQSGIQKPPCFGKELNELISGKNILIKD